ncbi:sm-like protein LSM2 [Cucumis melo var. makuwa]|uniref:Sm-like protein LSM2 n=1 Tax=Cucumis melo var. makuwa TaxID=1194695 RepID=A0A5A7UYK0_CUCMM|nr:sm-like protein LSM2 [Cucumis melo var. makuwa]
MLFFSYFKDLVGREVTVELKNDLAIRGTLHSVDQYLNIKLENTRVVDQDKYPHMLSVRNCFIRGSVVRYVQLPPDGVDVELLHDATRREARATWIMRDGSNVLLLRADWKDRWVADFIVASRDWIEDIVGDVFPIDVDNILNSPLGNSQAKDEIIWSLDCKGAFFVKSLITFR